MYLHIGSVDILDNVIPTVLIGVVAVVMVTVKVMSKNCQCNISISIY